MVQLPLCIIENFTGFAENYLLALYECDRKKEVSQLLEIIDITKFSSMHSIARLFEFLGKQLLESLAVKFLVAFKASGKFIASFLLDSVTILEPFGWNISE